LDALVDCLQQSRSTVVFTGAGVSTLSGLPDYRGPDGIYRQRGGAYVFDIDMFVRDPAFFYTHARDLFYRDALPEPSLVHAQCARLEQGGLVTAVVTQNIDMLHQNAGSQEVIELHGSPAWHTCLACDRRYPYEWARERVHRDGVPRCEDCQAVVKPDVTFFGEMLPEGVMERACSLAAAADVMLVLGSSLQVYPAASVPMVTVQQGGRLVIVNQGETSLDGHCHLRYDDLESVFNHLAAAL
jgi:NAD-dependent deacetylase